MTRQNPAEDQGRTRRDAILDAVAGVLTEKKRAANEMQEVVEQSGVSFADVEAEFDDTDEILLAVVSRVAQRVTKPLKAAASRTGDPTQDVEAVLMEFGSNVQDAFSTVLVGAIRVFMTESSRRKDLRERFHDAGPGAISADLRSFIDKAMGRGELDVDDSAMAAEQLMGLLREPLYLELALHPQVLEKHEAPSHAFHSAVRTFLDGYGKKGERDHG